MSFYDLPRTRIGRWGVACAVTCLFVVPLSGCGGEAIPTSEPAIIRFAYSGLGRGYYEPLIQEFSELYPTITVELVDSAIDDGDVFVDSQFALRERPWRDDVRSPQEDALDLNPLIEQDASFDPSDFYPSAVEAFTSEGELRAVPAGMDMLVMFYNRDLFDQYGVPYPEIGWTWDDFLNTALALRDPEAGVFGYAPTNRVFDATSFIYQHGGRIFDDWANPTRTTFDDPLTIEALQWYTGLANETNVAPTERQLYEDGMGGAGSVVVAVYLNKVGMWTGWLSDRGGGSRESQTWPGKWKMRWGMAPLPRDAQSATLMSVEGFFVSSQTRYPDACWQWVTFLSKQAPQRLMPARRSLADSAAYEQQVGSDVAAAAHASMEGAMMPAPQLFEFGGAWGIFWRALETIANGSSTPEEAMTRAQQEAGRIHR